MDEFPLQKQNGKLDAMNFRADDSSLRKDDTDVTDDNSPEDVLPAGRADGIPDYGGFRC
ncbi:MAG: hypothetical protein ACK58T_16670 [Phycisphaerae bacterium]